MPHMTIVGCVLALGVLLARADEQCAPLPVLAAGGAAFAPSFAAAAFFAPPYAALAAAA